MEVNLMRSSGSLRRWLAASALSVAGCATFDGNLAPLDNETLAAPFAYYQAASPIPARPEMQVFFEIPEVVDQDEGKDFTPIARAFAESMRKFAKEYFCRRGAFLLCTDLRREGDYIFRSKVVVGNYRTAYGGVALAMAGGTLLPPVVGLAWSLPVTSGSCTMGFSFSLAAPSGQEIWRADIEPQGGFRNCMDDRSASRLLMDVFEKFLPDLNGAALTHERTLQKQRAPIEAKALADKGAPGGAPAPPAEVLAVFDIQDASGLFSAAELLQLTVSLSTSMAAAGRYTVVPREQLRQRLLEEKTNSYRACYDDRCQIELGKAVAAQKTLATQILKVAEQCAVAANLFDLQSETSVRAAKVNAACSAPALLKALDEVSERLSR
jgi:hypothetical protein